jgi:hypothetical protein
MVGDLGVGCLPVRCYAVSADGQRFFVTQIQSRPPTPRVTHIRLIHGWLDEIKARLDGETSR